MAASGAGAAAGDAGGRVGQQRPAPGPPVTVRAKRLGLLREVVPAATHVGVLIKGGKIGSEKRGYRNQCNVDIKGHVKPMARSRNPSIVGKR